MILFNKKYKSLKKIIVLLFLVLIVIPAIAIYILQYIYSSEILKEKIFENTKDLLTQYSQILDNKFWTIDTCLLGIVQDNDVKDFMQNTRFGEYDSDLFNRYNKMYNYFFNTEIIYKDLSINSIVLIPLSKSIYTYNNNIFIQDSDELCVSQWHKDTIELDGKTNWIGWTKHNDEYTFDVAKVIKDEKTNNLIGVIYLSLFSISNIHVENINNSRILLYNEYQQQVVQLDVKHSKFIDTEALAVDSFMQGAGYFETKNGNDDSFTVYSPPNSYGIRVLEIIPRNQLLNDLSYISNISIMLLIVGLALFLIFLFLIIKEFINPLRHIANLISNIESEKGNLDYKAPPFYEFAKIGNGVVSLAENNKSIQHKLIEAEKNSSRIEYQKLQTQLNPHFLYNTLNAVRLMAAMNNEETIKGVMTSFIKLLSSSIDKQGEFVMVHQELENLNHYIYIENIIYEHKIQFRFELDESLNNLKIPNFILQPIIENCIIHGINPNSALGIITIRNYREKNDLYFEIEDNGCGISVEKQQQILSTLNDNSGFTRIGLKSVHNRIQIIYGNTYGLSIKSKETEGSIFSIKLPVISDL